MGIWKRRLLHGGLYALLFVVSTIAFLYFAFPWERAAPYVEAWLAKRFDMDVKIGSIAPDWVTGVELHDVIVRSRKPDRRGLLRTYHARAVRARVAVSTIFGGDIDVDYAIEGTQGTIEGQIYRAASDTRFIAHLHGVSPNDLSEVRDLVGLPMKGRLDGTVDLTLRDQQFAKAGGFIDLVARNVVVGDGKARLRLKVTPRFAELQEFLDREDQGVALPPMTVGTFTAKVRVSRGVARVTEMGSSSEHFEIKGEGTIDLRDPFSTSEVGLYVMYRFTDAYATLDSETRSMLDTMSTSPRYRQALRSDGFFGFRLQGVLRERIRSFPARDNVQIGVSVPPPAGAAMPPPPPAVIGAEPIFEEE